MQFNNNQIYHIFNQGNNKQQIFFTSENYEYYLFKLRGALIPFGDFIAYCLMPNHYHILFFVRKNQIQRCTYNNSIEASEFKRRKYKFGSKARPVKKKTLSISKSNEFVSVSQALGTVQSAYARAINNEKQRSGSLFRARFKARDGMISDFVETVIEDNNTTFHFSNHYAKVCMNYIHTNPVKAGMVKFPEDYIWSSAKDYAGLRKGTLCNLKLGGKLLGVE